MSLLRLLGLAAVALALCGCLATRTDELRADAAQCAAYGFRDGTPEMANCRQQRDQQRQAAGAAAVRQINQDNQRAVEQMERSLTPPTVNCTSTTLAGQTQTTCR